MASDPRGGQPPAPRLPADMSGRLERYGRYVARRMANEADYQELVALVLAPFAVYAATYPYSFCDDLLAIVAPDGGSLATLGAAKLVWDLVQPDHRAIPPALTLIRAGIAFKRAHSLPLTYNEMNVH